MSSVKAGSFRHTCQWIWGEHTRECIFRREGVQPVRNHRPSSAAVCRKHEMEKRRCYEQRIHEVEHSSFIPLVFSAVGGMGTAASVFYKRLASMLAEKQAQTYAKTIRWLWCTLSFSLLLSALMCIRGARSTWKRPDRPTDLEIKLAAAEGRIIAF